jgi:ABC-type uncharacterized transport system auxiliary subunit
MKKCLFISVVSLLLMSGCGGGKAIVPKYYLLEYPRHITADLIIPDSLAYQFGSCFIETVDVHPAFSSHQIAIRENTNQINYFSFNEWAVRPSQSFTKLITDFFSDTGLFSEINVGRSSHGNDFIIDTYVSKIEVVKSRSLFLANVELEFQLKDVATGEVISKMYDGEVKVMEKMDLNLFAATVSEIFVEKLHAFALQLNSDLKARQTD